MKSPRSLPSILLIKLFYMLVAQFVSAGSATWNLDPVSSDWNTAVNWMPPTVPNGPADVATFSLSNQTSLSTSVDTEVDSIVFDPGVSAFAVTIHLGELTASGLGI